VDADFEQATKDLKTLPKPHETHAEARSTRRKNLSGSFLEEITTQSISIFIYDLVT
jgi:hypothetical protein